MSFSKRDTNIVKGVAIIAMLFHHTYPNNTGIPIINTENVSVLLILATSSKICVALLTILSGYGLRESYKKFETYEGKFKNARFVFSHYLQLLSLYWVVVLFCLCTTYMQTGKGFSLYGSGITGFVYCLLDMLGLGMVFHTPILIGGWYLTAIVVFYILFPILVILVKKIGLLFVGVTYLPWIYYLVQKDYNMRTDWRLFYLFSFVLGIYLSEKNILTKWKEASSIKTGTFSVVFLGAMLIVRCFIALPADPFLSVAIIGLEVQVLSKISIINNLLEKCGAMSENMWLIHPFIIEKLNNLEFVDYTGKFMILFIVSIGMAILLEDLKKQIGYSEIVIKLRKKIIS